MSTNTPEIADERIKETSRFRQAMIRPELGGIVGTIAVLKFFRYRRLGDAPEE